MPDRYQHDGISPFLLCTHCGCAVWDRELHDRVNGLDLVDTAEQAMKGTTPLAPPEPPA